MKVYLIRHGETEYNKQRRLQGQCDIELNEYGRELARITALSLAEVEFDYAFSSPLKRAKETAEIIIGNREIPIVEDERIQEISFGEYEGLCFKPEGGNIPDKEFARFFDAPEQYTVPPKGESFAQIIERTGDFWRELTANPEYQDKTILISTHGCALKAILSNIRSTPVEAFWGAGVHKNCAVTIVEIKDGVTTVLEEGRVFYD